MSGGRLPRERNHRPGRNTIATRQPTFEAALEKLEENISRLESGDLTLQEALAYFEKGIALIRQCETQLKKAEGKLRELLEGENGEVVERIVGSDLTSTLGGNSPDERGD